jgi:polyferredoxin
MIQLDMKLSRYRVAFQVLLHIVLVGHVLAYYFLDWKAIGALDFQAFFHYFLGKGLLTAGGLLTIFVFGMALVFGRLFCSWGCHFGAIQDFAAWILKRLGWRPPLLRTRFLHWAPYLVLLVVFVQPVVTRWRSSAWGPVEVDLAGVPPWDTLPGWFLSVSTFLGCGVLLLLFLGTRGFCRFVCPYGAVFRMTDRVALFRVRRVDACASQCGSAGVHPCTAACPTAIDVHRETETTGSVTSSDCVRCNLCVEACPGDALQHVTARAARKKLDVRAPGALLPPVTAASGHNSAVAYDLPPWGEGMVLGAAIVTYLAVDLIYGGHFLAAAMALGEGFLLLQALRALRGSAAGTVLGWPLRRGRSWTLVGISVVGALVVSTVPIFSAATFKFLRNQGLRIDREVDETTVLSDAPRRIKSQLLTAKEVVEVSGRDRARLEEAADHYRRALGYFPSDVATRLLLLNAYVRLGDSRALREAEALLRLRPDSAQTEAIHARVLERMGRSPDAR